MKKLFWMTLFMVACSKSPSTDVLSPAQFEEKYKATNNAILIDVRSESEVANGKIMEAQNVVYDDDFAKKILSLPHQPLFVYCGIGKRSAKAAKILRKNGYKVFELEGGIKNWEAAGLPVK